MWSSAGGTVDYHLFIYQGQPEAGNLIISQTLFDTFYTVTDSLEPATHYWKVEIDGSSTGYRRFVTYSLDETYFPVGPGYVWNYMGVKTSSGRFGDGVDTSYYSIEVTDFRSEGDSLYAELSRGFMFTGNRFIYKNDSVFFFLEGLTSLSLIPAAGENMYDHEAGQERPDLWAEMNSDTTFHWGDTWGNGGEPYHDIWYRENWMKGSGMYLFTEGESYHYNNPDDQHPNGFWEKEDILVSIDRGE